MSNHQLRPATLQDVPDIHDLDLRVFGDLDGGYPDFFFSHMLQIFPDHFWVEVNMKGYCLAIPSKRDMWLYSLAVHPLFQRNQLGHAFLSLLISKCTDYYDNIYLNVEEHNTGAIEFYKRNSFKVVGENIHLTPTRLIMKRKIPCTR